MTYDEIMSILRPQYIFYAVVLVLSAATCSAVFAQTKQIKVEPVRTTTARTGDDLYREFCAVCHGVDAKGNGPAAAALKTRPTDLTQISRQNGNKFPATRMMRIINGDDQIAAHGTQDMPTWGDSFKPISANATFAEMRIRSLVEYLQKIQN